MASKQTQYRKFSGRSLLSVQKSFLADDHILVIDGHYKETYKRLYYGDIEAILICPTAFGMVIAIMMAILSGCLILPFILNGLSYLPLAIVGLIPAIVSIALFYGGGSVSFGVQTAVQLAILDGLNSRRKAEKARRLLVEEVERVQGVLSAPMLQAALERSVNGDGYSVTKKESMLMPSSSEDAPFQSPPELQ